MTETCNLIAAAKVGKTHLALDLALNVAEGPEDGCLQISPLAVACGWQ